MKKEVVNKIAPKKNKKNSDYDKRISSSLTYSTVSGSSYGVTDGTVNSYISPYAIALNASNNEVAWLTSIPSLLGPLSQLGTTKVMQKLNSRKKVLVISALLQTFMILPMILVPFLFLKNGALAIVILFSLYAIFGTFLGPAFTSWMGDIVPEDKRGFYFGNRSKIIGFVALVASLGAGFLLDLFPKYIFTGFIIIFLIGFFARLISINFMQKMYEPKFVIEKKFQFSFLEFVKKMPFNNFGRFSLYVSLINFAVSIAGPFITVYLLKDLQFSYAQFIIINVTSGIATLIGLPVWGKFGDKYGNIRILKICGFLIPVVPLLWTLSNNFYYLTIIQIYAGLVWSGFNLAAANFIFDSTTAQRRSLCDAYNNILLGAGVFFGAMLGGLLATHLNIGFMNKFLFLFLISFVIRILASLIMLPMIKEVKEVKRTPLLDIIGLTHRGFIHKTMGWHVHEKKK